MQGGTGDVSVTYRIELGGSSWSFRFDGSSLAPLGNFFHPCPSWFGVPRWPVDNRLASYERYVEPARVFRDCDCIQVEGDTQATWCADVLTVLDQGDYLQALQQVLHAPQHITAEMLSILCHGHELHMLAWEYLQEHGDEPFNQFWEDHGLSGLCRRENIMAGEQLVEAALDSLHHTGVRLPVVGLSYHVQEMNIVVKDMQVVRTCLAHERIVRSLGSHDFRRLLDETVDRLFKVSVMPETDNPHDRNALLVVVTTLDGRRAPLGYLRKEVAACLARPGWSLAARLASLSDGRMEIMVNRRKTL